jgi:hypothetical protein
LVDILILFHAAYSRMTAIVTRSMPQLPAREERF